MTSGTGQEKMRQKIRQFIIERPRQKIRQNIKTRYQDKVIRQGITTR